MGTRWEPLRRNTLANGKDSIEIRAAVVLEFFQSALTRSLNAIVGWTSPVELPTPRASLGFPFSGAAPWKTGKLNEGAL